MAMSVIEINETLTNLPMQIEYLNDSLGKLREDYLIQDAAHERDKARFYLETKAKQPESTVKEIEATAVILAFDARMFAIKSESAYRSRLDQIQAMRDRLEATKEQSYNLRQEMKNIR